MRYSCWISQLFFQQQSLVFWDVLSNPHIPSAGAKFLFVNHYFQSRVKGLEWEIQGMPLHWKAPNIWAVDGGSWTAGKQLARAITSGLLLKKCFMAPESTCMPEGKINLLVSLSSSETFGYRFPCRYTELLWVIQEKTAYLGLNFLSKRQTG